MKRNKFGINLDEGIPLQTTEDIKLLYVESNDPAEKNLINWLLHPDEKALMLGGQIGTGKTTLINVAFEKCSVRPDITFHFDRSSLNISALDAWVIVFAELARFSAKHYFNTMSSTFPDLKQILGETITEWESSVKEILLESLSAKSIEKNNALRTMLTPLLNQLPELFTSIITYLEEQEGRRIFLFASGVDKYLPGKPAYHGLTSVLGTVAKYHTLIEVNAVHLFENDRWAYGIDKKIIAAANKEWICTFLIKRLGQYADAYKKEIPLIAEYSGGIPRQALRILDSFIALKKKSKTPFRDALTSTNRDIFSFSSSPQRELLITVDKDQYLETSMIPLPGDTEDACKAVFGNWIILHSQIQDSKWSASLNPLIRKKWGSLALTEPEQILLTQYANQYGLSATGLNTIPFDETSFADLVSSIETPAKMNVTEVLDLISSALLSKNRADRVIVGFESKGVCDAVRAYFEAKSNSYEYQSWKHELIESDGRSPIQQILKLFQDTSVNVYSIELYGDFSDDELEQLNLFRDSLIDKQIILWVQKKYLTKYLTSWTQLRQLFDVFLLEDNLKKFLTIEEIQSDIDFMKDLIDGGDSAPKSYVKNLEKVLIYLKEVKNG